MIPGGAGRRRLIRREKTRLLAGLWPAERKDLFAFGTGNAATSQQTTDCADADANGNLKAVLGGSCTAGNWYDIENRVITPNDNSPVVGSGGSTETWYYYSYAPGNKRVWRGSWVLTGNAWSRGPILWPSTRRTGRSWRRIRWRTITAPGVAAIPKTRTDAKNQQVRYTYDSYDTECRVTSEQYPLSGPSMAFTGGAPGTGWRDVQHFRTVLKPLSNHVAGQRVRTTTPAATEACCRGGGGISACRGGPA
jgi:hypothetical protein